MKALIVMQLLMKFKMCKKKSLRKITAQRLVNEFKGKGEILRIYQCEDCNFWHLSNKERSENKYSFK